MIWPQIELLAMPMPTRAKLFPVPLTGFNSDNLKGHIPDEVIAQIPAITAIAKFIKISAQCTHKSCGSMVAYKNLNYSADG